MATVGQYVADTFIAGSDLSDQEYRFVTLAATGKVNLSANGDAVAGVLVVGAAAADRAVTVAKSGRIKVKVGFGGLNAGDEVAADTAGVAIAAATGDAIVGYALEDAVVDDVARIELRNGPAAVA